VSTPTIIATTSEIDESNTEFTVADVLYYLKDRTTLTTEHGKLEYAVEKYILGIDHLKDTPHESGPNYDDEEVRGNRAYITKKTFEGFDELGRKYKGRDSLQEILEYEFELWAIELNKEVITKNYVPTVDEQTKLKGWFKVLRNQARIQDTYPGLIRYMIESPIPDRIRKQ